MHWHIVRTKAHEEDRVAILINNHPQLHAFVPRLVKLIKRQGKLLREKRILFPNYVFIQTELSTDAFYGLIQNQISTMLDYIRILDYKDKTIETLSDAEKAYLSQFLNDRHEFEVSQGSMMDGKVLITEGPLQGYEGQITHINRHKHTARLSLHLFGLSQEVTVSLNILVKK